MELEELVRRRKMTRSFLPAAIEPAQLARILASATRAPSASHTQGAAFVVLEGVAATTRFFELTYPPAERARWRWPRLFAAPLVILCLSSRAAYLDRYAEPDKGWTDRDERRWPIPYWDIDAAFAAMLIQLTAIDVGLGALFFGLGGPGSALRGELEFGALREAYGIPETYQPIGAIAIGHPAPDDPPSTSVARGRRSPAEVIHHGRW